MTIPLTEEQSNAAAHPRNEPVRLVDMKTNQTFVLLPVDVYERLTALLTDDFDIRDTYPAQFAAAMRSGWEDAEMSDYDNYDEAYRKQCQSIAEKSS